MSATGAVSGKGVYSELEYKGKRFKLSQWTVDAMEAVSTVAFLQAAQMARIQGGTPKTVAEREVALSRAFVLGAFSFDAIMDDDGLTNNDALLAKFLFELLKPLDDSVTYELAQEIIKGDKNAVIKAIDRANPRNGQREGQPGPTADKTPAQAEQVATQVVDLVTVK